MRSHEQTGHGTEALRAPEGIIGDNTYENTAHERRRRSIATKKGDKEGEEATGFEDGELPPALSLKNAALRRAAIPWFSGTFLRLTSLEIAALGKERRRKAQEKLLRKQNWSEADQTITISLL